MEEKEPRTCGNVSDARIFAESANFRYSPGCWDNHRAEHSAEHISCVLIQVTQMSAGTEWHSIHC
jgi:hypothetical protein